MIRHGTSLNDEHHFRYNFPLFSPVPEIRPFLGTIRRDLPYVPHSLELFPTFPDFSRLYFRDRGPIAITGPSLAISTARSNGSFAYPIWIGTFLSLAGTAQRIVVAIFAIYSSSIGRHTGDPRTNLSTRRETMLNEPTWRRIDRNRGARTSGRERSDARVPATSPPFSYPRYGTRVSTIPAVRARMIAPFLPCARRQATRRTARNIYLHGKTKIFPIPARDMQKHRHNAWPHSIRCWR